MGLVLSVQFTVYNFQYISKWGHYSVCIEGDADSVTGVKSFLYCVTKYWALPEFLKVAEVQTHACPKFSRICAKFRLLKTKPVKQEQYSCFWLNLKKFWQLFTCLMTFLAHFFAQNKKLKNYDCAKKIHFRRSGHCHWILEILEILNTENCSEKEKKKNYTL